MTRWIVWTRNALGADMDRLALDAGRGEAFGHGHAGLKRT
jgi:hypothetical protein